MRLDPRAILESEKDNGTVVGLHMIIDDDDTDKQRK